MLNIFQHFHDPGLSDHFQHPEPAETSPNFFEGQDVPRSPNGVHTTLTLHDREAEDEAFAVAETLQRMRKAGQLMLFESKMGNTFVAPSFIAHDAPEAHDAA